MKPPEHFMVRDVPSGTDRTGCQEDVDTNGAVKKTRGSSETLGG
jgi:hypothetical protein